MSRSQHETPTRPKRKVRSSSSPDPRQEQSAKKLVMDQLGLSKEEFFKELDERLAKLASKEDVNAIGVKIEALEKENASVQQRLAELSLKEKKLESAMDEIINRSRRNNVVFRGLKPETKEWETEIKKFCVNVLKCSSQIIVNRAHPLGAGRSDGKPPPIIAHIPMDRDINSIFANAKNLQGTGFVVHRDFTPTVQSKRYNLRQIKAKIGQGSARTKIVFDHLYVGEKRFDWDLERGLICKGEDGCTVLKAMLQLDLTSFNKELLDKSSTFGRRPTTQIGKN